MKVISVSGQVKPALMSHRRGRLNFKKPILAIGVFDGVHLGHQCLIHKVIKKAKAIGGTSVVMTFWPHPVHVLKPELNSPLLIPLSLRLKLIASLGVQVCLIVRFTKKFSRWSPQKFVEKFLGTVIRPAEVFVGDDFRFGHDRSGHLDFLKNQGRYLGFKVNVVSSVHLGPYDVSSTLIRRLIGEGNLAQAAKLLNRKVSFLGKVIKGDSRGKRLGYPTANLNPASYVIPPRGVYLAQVEVNPVTHSSPPGLPFRLAMADRVDAKRWRSVKKKKLNALVNVGYRPSFKKSNDSVNLEVHILDFKENIYGQEILVKFLSKLRDEKEFASPHELIAQIKKDEIKARKFFSSRPSLL